MRSSASPASARSAGTITMSNRSPISSACDRPAISQNAWLTWSQRRSESTSPIPIGAFANAAAEALLRLSQLHRLLVQVDEHRDLRAQHLGVERLEHVVDRADGVALEDLLLLLVDRRQEDDRDVLGLRPALDQLGRLEAVHVRHLDIEQDRGEVVQEQPLQRLLAGAGVDDVHVQRRENGAHGQQVLRLVIDDQDVRALH